MDAPVRAGVGEDEPEVRAPRGWNGGCGCVAGHEVAGAVARDDVETVAARYAMRVLVALPVQRGNRTPGRAIVQRTVPSVSSVTSSFGRVATT